MHRTLSRLAIILSVVSALSLQGLAEPPKNGISWETDLLKAREIALKSDKPILLVFGAKWCTFCHKMEKSTLADKEMVKEINERFVPVHLDFDKQRSVANALKIKSIPCSVVLSTDADVLSRKDGFAKIPDYRKVLNQGLEAHRIRLTSGKASVITK